MSTSNVVYIDQSVADRKPQPRKRGSVVGSIPDPFRKRRVWFESGLEKDHLIQLIASPDVVDVKEQQKVEFYRGDKKAHHTFDILVQWKSLKKTACAVKYVQDCDQELNDDLEAIAEQVGDSFADRYVILTENWVGQNQVENARKIISCGQDHDYSAQDEIKEFLLTAGPRVTLADCDEWYGDGNRGSRAATALIQAGALVIVDGERLQRTTLLWNQFTK